MGQLKLSLYGALRCVIDCGFILLLDPFCWAADWLWSAAKATGPCELCAAPGLLAAPQTALFLRNSCFWEVPAALPGLKGAGGWVWLVVLKEHITEIINNEGRSLTQDLLMPWLASLSPNNMLCLGALSCWMFSLGACTHWDRRAWFSKSALHPKAQRSANRTTAPGHLESSN